MNERDKTMLKQMIEHLKDRPAKWELADKSTIALRRTTTESGPLKTVRPTFGFDVPKAKHAVTSTSARLAQLIGPFGAVDALLGVAIGIMESHLGVEPSADGANEE